MIELPLQRGPDQEAYYCIVDETGLDQLVYMRFENKEEIISRTAYRFYESKILSF